MDKTEFCVLPDQIIQVLQYLRVSKGADYACDFMVDILKYGCYETPIEQNYSEAQTSRIQTLMDQMKLPFLRMRQGGRKSTLDDKQIQELYEQGYSMTQIAEQLGCSLSTIKRHLAQYRM